MCHKIIMTHHLVGALRRRLHLFRIDDRHPLPVPASYTPHAIWELSPPRIAATSLPRRRPRLYRNRWEGGGDQMCPWAGLHKEHQGAAEEAGGQLAWLRTAQSWGDLLTWRHSMRPAQSNIRCPAVTLYTLGPSTSNSPSVPGRFSAGDRTISIKRK